MAGEEYFDPRAPHIGYSGRDMDKPQGVNIANSKTIEELGKLMAGDQGFENTPQAVEREYTGSVRAAGLAARVATLESQISVGAQFSDNFNRGFDSPTLGSQKPGTIPAWIQFGDGQALEIIDGAAQLARDALFNIIDDGTQFARCPILSDTDDYAVIAIVHPRAEVMSTRARTTLYGRCNAAGTVGIYADFYGDRCVLGRFTRNGNTVTRSEWRSFTGRSYSQSSTFELQMDGTRYRLVVDGAVIIDHEDTTAFPVGASYRTSMFSAMTWTPPLFSLDAPQFSAGLTGFSIRGIDMTAVAQATAAAQAAQDAADNAVDTAVEAAVGAVPGAVDGAIGGVKDQIEGVKDSVVIVEGSLLRRSYEHSMTNSEMTFGRGEFGVEPVTDVSLSGAVSNNSSTTWNRHRHTVAEGASNTGYETLSSHDHPNTFAVSSTTSRYLFTPPINAVVGGFLLAQSDGLRQSFTYATGPVTSPCILQLIVGTIDPTDGTMTVRWVSPDQTPIIGTGSGEFVPAIPDGVLLAGQGIVFVAAHQYGSGNPRPLWSKIEGGPAREGNLFPPRQATRFGRSSAMTVGMTVAAASFGFTETRLPWLGVGPALVLSAPAPTSYYIDFGSSGSMPSTLLQRSGTAATISGGLFAVSGGTDGERNYQGSKRLNRDNHFVEGRMVYGDTSQPQYLGLRADSTGNTRVVLWANKNGISIQRRGANGDTLASASTPIGSGSTLRFGVTGNVYSVWLVNGSNLTLLLQFTDSSNALPRGTDNRYATLGVSRFLLSNSGGWSNFRAADYPDAA